MPNKGCLLEFPDAFRLLVGNAAFLFCLYSRWRKECLKTSVTWGAATFYCFCSLRFIQTRQLVFWGWFKHFQKSVIPQAVKTVFF